MRLLSRAIRPMIVDLKSVGTGAEALAAIEQSGLDLLICDLNLPDISGMEVIAQVSREHPELAILVLTSSSRLDDVVAAVNAGAWDYIVKNFTPSFPQHLDVVLKRLAQRKLQLETQLRLQEERNAFWVAAHTASDGLAIVNENAEVIFSNHTFDAFVTQVSSGEKTNVVGSNVVDLISRYDSQLAQGLIQRIAANDLSILWSSELSVTLEMNEEKETRYFEITLAGAPSHGLYSGANIRSGSRSKVLWVRDVTSRKERERRQRDILSTTTHDLKGPLGAILTGSQLLDYIPEIGDHGRELTTRIASCARKCITLIDELLSANRIQDGVLILRPHKYVLADILEDVMLDFEPVSKAQGVALMCTDCPKDLEVYADKIALMRVIANLVSNAVKFTSKGGRVSVFAESNPREVRISVEDTGTGVDSARRQVLFERYSRLERHSEVEGTGLGLYVVKNIMDAHGGRIEVSSEVGAGATFVVCLPHEAPK